jgi:hypothetical protein
MSCGLRLKLHNHIKWKIVEGNSVNLTFYLVNKLWIYSLQFQLTKTYTYTECYRSPRNKFSQQ